MWLLRPPVYVSTVHSWTPFPSYQFSLWHLLNHLHLQCL